LAEGVGSFSEYIEGSMSDLTELLRLSEAATAGEWQTNGTAGSPPNGVFACQPTGDPDVYDPEIFVCSVKPRWDDGCAVGDEAIANALFIAAARNYLTPDRIRRLIELETINPEKEISNGT
jgi:hypothetical protein